MPDTEARIAETMSYVEGTIHGQGYAHLFAPEEFEPQDIVHGRFGLGQLAVKHQGREFVETGFRILDPQLGRHAYADGNGWTIADAALFNVKLGAAAGY